MLEITSQHLLAFSVQDHPPLQGERGKQLVRGDSEGVKCVAVSDV